MDTSNAPNYTVWGNTRIDNGIGGHTETPKELFSINGYLDLITGDERITYNAFMEESTHVLLTDYRTDIKRKEHWITDDNGNRYDITLVDDPVNMHKHLEIYLKFVGDK